MRWSLVADRWQSIRARLVQRFPELSADALPTPPPDRDALVRFLAETNELTLFEAREELDDLLQIEMLALPLDVHFH